MPIITLISDFGTKDYAVAAVKGQLLRFNPQATIVDISHEISPFNIVETAFILNAVYPQFPEKTIHIIGVESAATKLHKHLIVSIENHIFIGADNGIFSLLQPNKYQKIIEIQHKNSDLSNFPVKDVFCDIAAKIANGISIDSLGKKGKKVNVWKRSNPMLSNDIELVGHILYVDRFGNLISDISKREFHLIRKNRKFEILVSSIKINNILLRYEDFVETE